MVSSFGNRFKITVFGEAHGTAIGVVIDGLPPGEALDLAALNRFMTRRAPGQGVQRPERKRTPRRSCLGLWTAGPPAVR